LSLPDADSVQEREQFAEAVGERAENLYRTGQLMCSEAVLLVLNRGLGGGIPDDVAIRLASALPIGMGDSGCACGALSGAALAVGLFLGRSRPGSRDQMDALKAANLVHDRFKGRFGATCCRVLTKKVKGNNGKHFEQCARITGEAAEMAAHVILDRRPDLLSSAETNYVNARDSWLEVRLRKLMALIRPSKAERK
jgi:C_GCAxxG_C_C family probable redox protein